MNIQLDIKNTAKSIESFLTAHGGEAQHGEVLELIAKIAGFTNYRALKAQEDTTTKPRINTTVSTSEIRTLESDKYVVFRAEAVDWQLAYDSDIGLDEVPAHHRTTFDVIMEQQGSQFRVLMKPKGVHLDNFDGNPVLDVLLEINHGVPCVHLTNDPADEMLVTVFATKLGLVVRPDGGEWLPAHHSRVPGDLEVFTREVTSANELEDTYVVVLDTKAKYEDDSTTAANEIVAVVKGVQDEPFFEQLEALKVFHESPGQTTLSESIGHSERQSELDAALVDYVKMVQDDNLKGTYRILGQIEVDMGVWEVVDKTALIIITDGVIVGGSLATQVTTTLENLRRSST